MLNTVFKSFGCNKEWVVGDQLLHCFNSSHFIYFACGCSAGGRVLS